jgi:hypothetical protein
MITEWIEIKRDKNEFSTEESLNKMFENELIIVARSELYRVYYDVIKREKQVEWRGEIDRNIRYTHYLPINYENTQQCHI